jgi:hypothetical protein
MNIACILGVTGTPFKSGAQPLMPRVKMENKGSYAATFSKRPYLTHNVMESSDSASLRSFEESPNAKQMSCSMVMESPGTSAQAPHQHLQSPTVQYTVETPPAATDSKTASSMQLSCWLLMSVQHVQTAGVAGERCCY